MGSASAVVRVVRSHEVARSNLMRNILGLPKGINPLIGDCVAIRARKDVI